MTGGLASSMKRRSIRSRLRARPRPFPDATASRAIVRRALRGTPLRMGGAGHRPAAGPCRAAAAAVPFTEGVARSVSAATIAVRGEGAPGRTRGAVVAGIMKRFDACSLAAVAAVSLLSLLAPSAPAAAATFSVLHTFSGGSDGANPLAGLTVDRRGDLYGTAEYGGSGNGTAFELRRTHGAFTFDVLYTFAAGNDGAAPAARLMAGPDGLLYGTATAGGGGGGTVFTLSGGQKRDPRKEKSLYRFIGSGNGIEPSNGDLAFDAAGNMYGTTLYGGTYNAGTVFSLTRSGSRWHE